MGPSPPAISTLYLSIAFLQSAAQSTPAGTLIVLTVTRRCSGLATYGSSPIAVSPSHSCLCTASWRAQEATRPSSLTMASASRIAYHMLTRPVWW